MKDAYIELDEAVVDGLIDRFLNGLPPMDAGWTDRAAFRRLSTLPVFNAISKLPAGLSISIRSNAIPNFLPIFLVS